MVTGYPPAWRGKAKGPDGGSHGKPGGFGCGPTGPKVPEGESDILGAPGEIADVAATVFCRWA